MVIIDPALRAQYPEVFSLSLPVSDINATALTAVAASELAKGAEQLRASFAGVAQISDHPSIAPWRATYGAQGVKPSKFKSSIEALTRRALNGDPPSIHPLVDIYNAISMRFGVPLGAVDADKVNDPVELRHCRPDQDSFTPLGADEADFPKLASVPVYAVGTTILCWCFNCRDAAPTALSTDTTNAIFFSEGINSDQRGVAGMALAELGRIFGSCGAQPGSISG